MGFAKLKLDMDFVKANARKTVYIVHLSYIFFTQLTKLLNLVICILLFILQNKKCKYH